MRRAANRLDDAYGLDVVGLGALNVDLIATRSSDEDQPVMDSETLTASREIVDRLEAENLAPVTSLGGSAFNAMTMLAQLRTNLRLGMVGISAATPDGLQESHTDRLRTLNVVDLTRRSEQRPGLCLALPSVHGRKLRTAPEANLEIADYLHTDDRLRAIVSGARILHLTSLLENPSTPSSDEVAKAVAGFIETVKEDNPELILSFDPGHTWVDRLDRRPAVRRIFALSDVVHANEQEYALLTGGADTRSTLRARSLRRFCPGSTLIVLKALEEVVVQHAGGFDLARVPRVEKVVAVDPTGAGEAVAAGCSQRWGSVALWSRVASLVFVLLPGECPTMGIAGMSTSGVH